MKDYELAKISLEELLQPAVERRLQELTPEQRVAGLTPEQLAKALTHEQLTEMLEALPPQVRKLIKQRLH